MKKRFIHSLVLLLFILLLSACQAEGEQVLVYIAKNEHKELLKVNAITNYNKQTNNLSIKAVMDVYDQDNKYLRTTLFSTKGSVEQTISARHEEGPITIYTKQYTSPHTVTLIGTKREKVKKHIIEQTKLIKDKKEKNNK
ncbi:hypothetical protein [Litchfieldia alkalitelluris]|uniref:hypothetical protein n=1 Tax=Litchfieldia alkalitelluris TaxID=304268 RepID=UPI0009976761|nr:hypothetical protein [Litchfieldia alkalitelluris]